jgi:2,3-bisphosphoglycerate-dependent phosphoglycerate mutase
MKPDVDIILVRHCESIWNSLNLVQGQSPLAPGLTPAGKKQAVVLARTLRHIDTGLIFTSDLRRTIDTALPIARALKVPLKVDRRLRERSFGDLEGSSNQQILPAEVGIDGIRVTDIDVRPAGGESLSDFYDRTADFFSDSRIRHSTRPIIVVTHGGVVRMALACLSDVPLCEMDWNEVPNASIVKIRRNLSVNGREVHNFALHHLSHE